MKFIVENATAIILAIVGLFATGIVYKTRKTNKNSNNTNKVSQSNISAGGDVAGGNINK